MRSYDTDCILYSYYKNKLKTYTQSYLHNIYKDNQLYKLKKIICPTMAPKTYCTNFIVLTKQTNLLQYRSMVMSVNPTRRYI